MFSSTVNREKIHKYQQMNPSYSFPVYDIHESPFDTITGLNKADLSKYQILKNLATSRNEKINKWIDVVNKVKDNWNVKSIAGKKAVYTLLHKNFRQHTEEEMKEFIEDLKNFQIFSLENENFVNYQIGQSEKVGKKKICTKFFQDHANLYYNIIAAEHNACFDCKKNHFKNHDFLAGSIYGDTTYFSKSYFDTIYHNLASIPSTMRKTWYECVDFSLNKICVRNYISKITADPFYNDHQILITSKGILLISTKENLAYECRIFTPGVMTDKDDWDKLLTLRNPTTINHYLTGRGATNVIIKRIEDTKHSEMTMPIEAIPSSCKINNASIEDMLQELEGKLPYKATIKLELKNKQRELNDQKKRQLKQQKKMIKARNINQKDKQSSIIMNNKRLYKEETQAQPSGWLDEDVPSVSYDDVMEFMDTSDYPYLSEILDSPLFFKILISLVSLYRDPSIANLFIWMIACALEFDLTPYKLYQQLKECAPYLPHVPHKMWETLKRYFLSSPSEISPVPAQRREEPAEEAEIQASASALGSEEMVNIASIGVAFATTIACVTLGLKNFCSEEKGSFIQRCSKTGAHISKIKSGAYSIINMVQDVHYWIKDAMSNFLIKGDEAKLSMMLETIPLKPNQQALAKQYFEKVAYYSNPANEMQMKQRGPETQKEVDDLIVIANHTLYLNSIYEIKLSAAQVKLVEASLKTLIEVRKSLSKYPHLSNFRKTPFWVYIAGEAGKGKSALMAPFITHLTNTLREVDAIRYNNTNHFELPVGDMTVHAANFSDKYMTGYKHQFCTVIDDVFQDPAPLGETSSALNIIGFVSCVPCPLNMADLSEKGTLFTSNLLLTTSNVLCPRNRPEVSSPEALLRRRSVVIEMLDRSPYRFNIRHRLNNTIIKADVDFDYLMAYVVNEYEKHWNNQLELEEVHKHSSPRTVSHIMELYSNLDHQTPTLNKIDTEATPSGVIIDNTLLGNLNTDTHGYWRVMTKWFFTLLLFYYTGLSIFFCNSISNLIHGELDISTKLYSDYYKWYLPQCFSTPWELVLKKIHLQMKQLTLEIVKRTIKKYLTIINFIKIIAGILVAYFAFKWWTKPKEAMSSQIAYNNSPQKIKSSLILPSHYNQQVPKVKTPVVVPSSFLEEVDMSIYDENLTSSHPAIVVDKNAQNLVHHNLINKNGVVRIYTQSKGQTYFCNAMRIQGRYILCNHHFFQRIINLKDQTFYIDIKTQGGSKVVAQIFETNRMFRIKDRDAAVYRCDDSMPAAADIICHFPNDIYNRPYSSVLVSKFPSEVVVAGLLAIPQTQPVHWAETSIDGSLQEDYRTINYWAVKNYAQMGASGSALVAINNNIQAKIIGIQSSVVDSSKTSYIEPIFRIQLEEAITKLSVDSTGYPVYPAPSLDLDEVVITAEASSSQAPDGIFKNGLIYLGKSKTRISTSSKTRLRESRVQHLFDKAHIRKFPSVLHRDDPRILESKRPTMNLALARAQDFDRQYGAVDMTNLEHATSQVSHDIFNLTSPIGRRILTNHETVNGCTQYLKKFDMYTSPGLPWIIKRTDPKKNGKWEWFEKINQDEYRMGETLQRAFDDMEQRMLQGKRPTTSAYYCIKDECVKIDKIEEARSRGFICLDQCVNLIVRKYCGGFLAAQRSHAGEIPSCVGINPFDDWTTVCHKLLEKSTVNWQDFDYKNWDSSITAPLISAVFRVINDWYGPHESFEIKRLRRIIGDYLAYTPLIINNQLVLKTGGIPSGCAMTAEGNTLAHQILLTYVWRKFWLDQGLANLVPYSEFKKHCSAAIYGDDVVLSVSNEAREFNGNNIKHYFDTLGMQITSGNKDQNFEFKKPEEVTFLKRSFRKDPTYPNKYTCPLNEISMLNMLHWIHKSVDEEAATKENFDTCLRESVQYGVAYYKRLVNQLTSPRFQASFTTPYIPKEFNDLLNQEIYDYYN